MTLYRKYRPQTLDQIVGQEPVTQVLSQAIATDKVAHAYLFAGSRGTGKTSVARIVAKALNCLKRADGLTGLPCNQCDHCLSISKGSFLDVLELDAASNRGIDEIRALKEQVSLAPAMGGYKVYILDEVHMLTAEAFNALLKTLEEPPDRVVFMLCTTEFHKVPVTITSRCQRLVFQRATVPQLQQSLQTIVAAEGIKIDDEAIALLAELADGGYRDAAMLLEQLSAHQPEKGKLSRQQIESSLGLANRQLVQSLVTQIIAQDTDSAIAAVEQFVAQGGDVRYLTANLLEQFRLLLFCLISPQAAASLTDPEQLAWAKQTTASTDQAQLLRLTQALIEAQQAKPAAYPALPLELAIAGGAVVERQESQVRSQKSEVSQPEVESGISNSHATSRKPAASQASTSAVPAAVAEVVEVQPSMTEKVEVEVAVEVKPAAPAKVPEDLQRSWAQILDTIRPQSRSVEALLRDCTPLSFDGTILLLQFWYAFHKKQLELDKNRRLVEEVASQVLGGQVKIRGQLGDKLNRPKKPMTEADLKNVGGVEEPNLVEAAAEIFGGEIID